MRKSIRIDMNKTTPKIVKEVYQEIYSKDPFKIYKNIISQIEKREDNILLSAADTQNQKSTKRGISAIQNKIIEALVNEKSITNHFRMLSQHQNGVEIHLRTKCSV